MGLFSVLFGRKRRQQFADAPLASGARDVVYVSQNKVQRPTQATGRGSRPVFNDYDPSPGIVGNDIAMYTIDDSPYDPGPGSDPVQQDNFSGGGGDFGGGGASGSWDDGSSSYDSSSSSDNSSSGDY